MSENVSSVLIHFCMNNQSENKKLVKNSFNEIKKELEIYFDGLENIFEQSFGGDCLRILKDNSGVICTLRFFEKGSIITVNIEYFKEAQEKEKFSFSTSQNFATAIEKKLKMKHSQALPAIQRGELVRYLPLADGRITEIDSDFMMFNESSEFQKVQIVHSKSFGNLLVLDELQNLAEADLIYTETLMQRGKENYEGKEICILGGGDGALLYELLKENPKHVVMLEIDDLVMEACNKYMSSICGDVLEVRKRENYEIIVGDCMVWLEKYIKDGKNFDYVFGDLTDIPISDTPTGEIWDFIRTILESSFKILKPDGKFLTHGNGASCPESLEMYEQQLKKLRPVVEFTRDTAFVPSFMEDWIFYQVTFADQ